MSEWNTFEFMDRAATVELLIAELLTDHPVGEHPALEAKLTALEEAAGALYQAAGTHHHTLTPAKPVQPDHFGDSNEMVAATVKRLEERVATAEAGAKFAVSGYNKAHALDFDVGELKNRVAKLEAATPAKVRVVAPEADGMHTPVWRDGWRQADRAWRAALAAAGVEVKEATNGRA
jgi:hypothetical protein